MGMKSVFSEIGHGLEVAAKDIAKGAEEALTVGAKVLKVIADVKAISPEFKHNLATLVDDAKAIAVPLAPVVASGGENVAADLAAIVPVLEAIGDTFEILFVNDGSRDGTLGMLAAAASQDAASAGD